MTGNLSYEAVRARNAQLMRNAAHYRSAAGASTEAAEVRSVRRSWKLLRGWRIALVKPLPAEAKGSRN
jgi:hypothetical protein